MLTWIVLAVLGCALLVLVAAVRPVLTRLPALRRAALALQRRQDEAEALAAQAEQLQLRLAKLEQSLAATGPRPGRPGDRPDGCG
ncbi:MULTISPECIES: hypothetical protein [unclassified Micromonospora]|uniref:hypothetical protein n=1 Tax=unclassified Micromonospora TaxID=2617518 RepID=UPI003A855D48